MYSDNDERRSSEGASDDLGKRDTLLGEFKGSAKLWIGKDYTNFIVKDFVQLDQPLQGISSRFRIDFLLAKGAKEIYTKCSLLLLPILLIDKDEPFRFCRPYDNTSNALARYRCKFY